MPTTKAPRLTPKQSSVLVAIREGKQFQAHRHGGMAASTLRLEALGLIADHDGVWVAVSA